MDLINDLGTELAFAFLVEKRYRQKIDSEAALALIGRVQNLLAATAKHRAESTPIDNEVVSTTSAH